MGDIENINSQFSHDFPKFVYQQEDPRLANNYLAIKPFQIDSPQKSEKSKEDKKKKDNKDKDKEKKSNPFNL